MNLTIKEENLKREQSEMKSQISKTFNFFLVKLFDRIGSDDMDHIMNHESHPVLS